MTHPFAPNCIILLAFSLIAIVSPASAQSTVVQCYDKERNVVQPRFAADCKGEVLSEAEAKRLKAKLHRERIKRAMQPKSERHQGPRGHGTGFFVTGSGLVVTNNHVIEKCTKVIWVDTTDGKEGTAKVVGTDKENDLALLKTTLKAPAVAIFRTPVELGPGSAISVIGYGTEKLPPIRPKLLSGTFEGPNRTGTRLQMEVAVRPGNSGGPVLDSGGHVVGVIYAQANTPALFKKKGELILDRGFAISNPVALRFLDSHNVAYKRTSKSEPRSHEALFKHAKPFIARVSCPR